MNSRQANSSKSKAELAEAERLRQNDIRHREQIIRRLENAMKCGDDIYSAALGALEYLQSLRS